MGHKKPNPTEESPSPCLKCTLREKCSKELLACRGFISYINLGKYSHEALQHPLPNHELFHQAFPHFYHRGCDCLKNLKNEPVEDF